VTRPAHRRRVPWRYAAPTVAMVAGVALLLVAVWLSVGPGGEPVVGGHLTAAQPDPVATDSAPAGSVRSPGAIASSPAGDDAQPAVAAEPSADRSDPVAGPEPDDRPAAHPVALEIPRIGLDAQLIELGLDDDRGLEVPDDPDVPGWYTGGPRPGDEGPAVIAGHVDSYRGPAVFWQLPELEPGDEILVHGEDGSTIRFAVERLGRWPKDDFPTEQVYVHADGAELRLITCGGAFDEAARSYRDNIVVFASEVD
jgi:sortase (surface protein transpeptidase)